MIEIDRIWKMILMNDFNEWNGKNERNFWWNLCVFGLRKDSEACVAVKLSDKAENSRAASAQRLPKWLLRSSQCLDSPESKSSFSTCCLHLLCLRIQLRIQLDSRRWSFYSSGTNEHKTVWAKHWNGCRLPLCFFPPLIFSSLLLASISCRTAAFGSSCRPFVFWLCLGGVLPRFRFRFEVQV